MLRLCFTAAPPASEFDRVRIAAAIVVCGGLFGTGVGSLFGKDYLGAVIGSIGITVVFLLLQ